MGGSLRVADTKHVCVPEAATASISISISDGEMGVWDVAGHPGDIPDKYYRRENQYGTLYFPPIYVSVII